MSIQMKMNKSVNRCYRFFNGAYSMPMKSIFLSLLVSMVSVNHAQAEEDAVTDRFMIALGGYALTRYDSSISLTDPDLGAGLSVSPEDTLGMNTDQAVVRLDGYYRFNAKHALNYSWYSISSEGNKTMDEEFEWTDDDGTEITIPVGATVTSSLDYDIFKIGYLWSFHHTDKVELAFGAGLHLTRMALDISASSTIGGGDTSDVSTNVPLPVVSFSINYNVTPKFKWYLRSQFFALKFDDWDGSYTDTMFGMEHRTFKHIGLGIALGNNNLTLTEDTDEHKFVFDNQISGALLYVAAYF